MSIPEEEHLFLPQHDVVQSAIETGQAFVEVLPDILSPTERFIEGSDVLMKALDAIQIIHPIAGGKFVYKDVLF